MSAAAESLLVSENFQDARTLYRQLREKGPLFYDKQHEFWVATHFDVVSELLRHPDVSSNRDGMSSRRFRGMSQEQARKVIGHVARSMLSLDPPEHTVLRNMANPLLNQNRVQGWASLIKSRFAELLAPCVAACRMGAGFDLVHDLAQPYPTGVICELFAIPPELREHYRQLTETSLGFFGYRIEQFSVAEAATAAHAMLEARSLISTLLKERAESPGDDLLSEMAVHVKSGDIPLDDMARLGNLIVTAGHVTTIDLLGNGIYQLLSHPDQWELLVNHPELAPKAVEEILRYDSSIPFVFRTASKSITLAGQTIPEGSYIALGLAVANHDPAINPDPDVFDIQRERIRHMAFSQGPHVCLGANLARLELTIALQMLAAELPDLRFAEVPEPLIRAETLLFKGFYSLPVMT